MSAPDTNELSVKVQLVLSLGVVILIIGTVVAVAGGTDDKTPAADPTPAASIGDRSLERASRGHARASSDSRAAHRPGKATVRHETNVSRTPAAKRRTQPTTAMRLGTTAGVWDRIAACESGGNWHARGGMFEGGLQFLPSTWAAAGGHRYARHAYDATREQQIRVARAWLARTSWDSQWPACSRRLGL